MGENEDDPKVVAYRLGRVEEQLHDVSSAVRSLPQLLEERFVIKTLLEAEQNAVISRIESLEKDREDREQEKKDRARERRNIWFGIGGVFATCAATIAAVLIQ